MKVFGQLLRGRVRRIPLAVVTNEFSFSFARDGWNYIRSIVAEYEKDRDISLEQTIFYRFFTHPFVRNVRYLNDILFLHDPERRYRNDFKFYLGTYPWGDHVGGGPWGHYFDAVSRVDTASLYGPDRNPWYRPGDRRPLEKEWDATLRLYRSMRSAGYRPLARGGFPEVTLLVKRSGEFRAVRYNGQHRLAVLSHLGYRRVTVLVPSPRAITRELTSWPSASSLPKVVERSEVVVREEEVDRWPYVRRGLCSREQALEIFHAFFELTGRERIEALGLPSVY